MNGQPVLGKEGASGSLLWFTGLLERPLSRPRRTWNCGALTGTATEGSSWWDPCEWVQPAVQAVRLALDSATAGGGSACNGWMLGLSITRYTVCDRGLLEPNFGWNNMGDKHRVCVQWSADVCNCLRWPAHLPVARKIFTRTDGLMVLLWRFYDSSLSPSFCRGLALWSRTLSWKYTQLYLGAFFFGELIICFFWHFSTWWILWPYTWCSF